MNLKEVYIKKEMVVEDCAMKFVVFVRYLTCGVSLEEVFGCKQNFDELSKDYFSTILNRVVGKECLTSKGVVMCIGTMLAKHYTPW